MLFGTIVAATNRLFSWIFLRRVLVGIGRFRGATIVSGAA